MAIQVRVGGTWQSLSACKIFSGGAWRNIVAVRIFSGGVWRAITFPTSGGDIALSISPSPFAFTGHAKITGSLTATPSAGVSPYTYAWSLLSGSGGVQFGSARSATTTVTSDNLNSGVTETVTLRCVVTDNLGNTTHADVSGTFSA